MASANQYTLHIPKGVERQLRQCRASIRQSIRQRLQAIAESAAAGRSPVRPSPKPQGPPLRFYVFEGFRVSYQVSATDRKVVVLNLRAESG